MSMVPLRTPGSTARPGDELAMAPKVSASLAAPGGGEPPGIDVVRVLRTNLWLILIGVALSIVLGIGAYAYLLFFQAKYTAVGLLEVRSTFFDPLESAEPQLVGQALEVEQRTQAQRLVQEGLFASVLQNPQAQIRSTDWFKQFSNPLNARETLARDFQVRPFPESRVLQVSMTAPKAQDAQSILVDVIEQHLANQRKLNVQKQQERSQALEQLRKGHQDSLTRLQQDMRERVSRLSIDGMGSPGRISSKEIELQDLLKTQFELERERTAAQTAYNSLVNQMQNGGQSPRVEEIVKHDQNVVNLQQLVNNLDVQLAMAQSMGSEHRSLERLQIQRDAAQHKLDDAMATARASTGAALTEELQGQLAGTDKSLSDLSTRIDGVKQDLGELYAKMAEYLAMRDESETIKTTLLKIDAQLEQLRQSERQGNMSGVTWLDMPVRPERPSFPRLPLVMGAAILLGVGASLGVAFLREMLDTSVRSPRDVQRVGQLNLLGIVAHETEDPQGTGEALPLIVARAPHSVLAEQFRQVRTRLQHAGPLERSRSLLITSPGPGDGKSTIACNLATSLALNGRRVLLVDANLRRPELHKVFALPNKTGFTTVLGALDTFDANVAGTEIPNLGVMSSGPDAARATDLLDSAHFTEFVDRAVEEYDHVIFDGAPLLFVSEAGAMAPRVDGVITVVRAQSNSRGVLERLRDTLRQLKADHRGLVLNAVRHQAGGYYTRNIKQYYAYQNGSMNH